MKEIYVYDNIVQFCDIGIQVFDDAQVFPATYDIYNNVLAANVANITNAHATPLNLGLNSFDALIGINDNDPGVELKVEGTATVSDSLIAEYTASTNTLVITPTATGRLDTLETSDITEITLDTLNVNYITVNSLINYEPPHGHFSFHDSSETLTMSTGVWVSVTNATFTLFTNNDADNITFDGDSVTIDAGFGGDYMIDVGLSFSGTATDSYEIAIFKNNVLVNGIMERTTSQTDVGYIGLPTYLTGLVAGDDLTFKIRNTASNDDATVIACSWRIYLFHP